MVRGGGGVGAGAQIRDRVRDVDVREHVPDVLHVDAVRPGPRRKRAAEASRMVRRLRVVGADPDIIVASAKAYLSALNKLQSKADRVPAQG